MTSVCDECRTYHRILKNGPGQTIAIAKMLTGCASDGVSSFSARSITRDRVMLRALNEETPDC
jgi:hypothetical protein